MRIKLLGPAVFGRDRVTGRAGRFVGTRASRPAPLPTLPRLPGRVGSGHARHTHGQALLETGLETRIVSLLHAPARRRSCRRPTASMEVIMAVKERSSREP